MGVYDNNGQLESGHIWTFDETIEWLRKAGVKLLIDDKGNFHVRSSTKLTRKEYIRIIRHRLKLYDLVACNSGIGIRFVYHEAWSSVSFA
jgi:hypothetical protein